MPHKKNKKPPSSSSPNFHPLPQTQTPLSSSNPIPLHSNSVFAPRPAPRALALCSAFILCFMSHVKKKKKTSSFFFSKLNSIHFNLHSNPHPQSQIPFHFTPIQSSPRAPCPAPLPYALCPNQKKTLILSFILFFKFNSIHPNPCSSLNPASFPFNLRPAPDASRLAPLFYALLLFYTPCPIKKKNNSSPFFSSQKPNSTQPPSSNPILKFPFHSTSIYAPRPAPRVSRPCFILHVSYPIKKNLCAHPAQINPSLSFPSLKNPIQFNSNPPLILIPFHLIFILKIHFNSRFASRVLALYSMSHI